MADQRTLDGVIADLRTRLRDTQQELEREVRMHQERSGALQLEVNRRLAAESRLSAAEQERNTLHAAMVRWQKESEVAVARAEAAELQLFGVLCAFYDADPVACSGICDDRIDPSGALLGRVREATEKAQQAWDDINAS